MKLLMISGDRSLASGKEGAFSAMLTEFALHFERIDIICPKTRDTRLETRVFPANVHIHPSPHGLWRQVSWIKKKGMEIAAAEHPDVMTVHEYPPFYNGLGARALSRMAGIPAVLEIHHIVGWPVPASVTEQIGFILSRLLLGGHANQFAAVRVVNETVKKLLSTWGVREEKISVVPSVYLDHGIIDSSKNQEKKYDLTFAARLTDNKGLLPVIEALAVLPDRKLLVIGDGPQRHAAEARAKSLGIADQVTFTGWLPTALDTAKAIASGKVFVMNSKSEGNPRVAVEAMALGLPILATKVGIMPDIMKEGVNGYFTDGSAKDIAEKATKILLDESGMQRMGNSATNIRSAFEKKAAIKAYADFLISHVH